MDYRDKPGNDGGEAASLISDAGIDSTPEKVLFPANPLSLLAIRDFLLAFLSTPPNPSPTMPASTTRQGMMDWKGAMKEERAALMRIVALLNALAGLAELAASRSPAMRGFVLWVLRHAEDVARDFVAGGPDAPIAPMPVEPAGTRPADAMRLAAGLRRLARQLARQLERQARLISAACGGRVAGTEPPLFGRMPAMRDVANALSMLAAFAWRIPHPAPDTS